MFIWLLYGPNNYLLFSKKVSFKRVDRVEKRRSNMCTEKQLIASEASCQIFASLDDRGPPKT